MKEQASRLAEAGFMSGVWRAIEALGGDFLTGQLSEKASEFKHEVRYLIEATFERMHSSGDMTEDQILEFIDRMTWKDYRRFGALWYSIKNGGVRPGAKKTPDDPAEVRLFGTGRVEIADEEFSIQLERFMLMDRETFRREMDKMELDKDLAYYSRAFGEYLEQTLGDLSEKAVHINESLARRRLYESQNPKKWRW